MATKDKEDAEQHSSRYGEELLSANWNPVVELLEAARARPSAETRAAAPQWREEDVAAFLGRVYKAGN